jgi:hypothetical protein
MKSSYFSNKKSLQIISTNIRNDIKTQINELGSFNLNSKYYTFLNKKNVNNLKDSNFLVSLSTFGKKFILFITKYNSKNYCIFINKKNDTMTVTQLKFSDEIFSGTLFDGELVKNSNDKWIYLINDIAYYKGENIITKSFIERQKIIEKIINIEQENNEEEDLYISKKIYFEYKNIKDLIDNYMNNLNYKCSGLYFKNINNFSDNYLFIFPECRSDSKILNKNELITDNNNEDENELFNNVEKIEKIIEKQHDKLRFEKQHDKIRLEKTTCKFLINTTDMPDIYELYCKNSNNNIEKHSYASVPDIDTSNLLKNIIGNNYNQNEDIDLKIKNNNAIYVECNYHKLFKKWIPFKKVDSIDSINTINHIQIILDSL